jgi:ferredoxin
LQPWDQEFQARSDETVLQAALRSDVQLASSCRNGTCRTCIAMLHTGHIRYRIEWPGVSAEEKAEGYFLPCVAEAQSDLVMRQAV